MADIDKRGMAGAGQELPVFKKSITQMTWATGEGNDEQTEVKNINGEIGQIGIRISSVTDNPTVVVTLTDADGNELYNSGSIADGTNYLYTPSEFLPTAEKFLCAGDITIGVTPSADPGGAAQLLTVDVDIFGR
jgi:hypothetical protein